jgi:hypothetical protein
MADFVATSYGYKSKDKPIDAGARRVVSLNDFAHHKRLARKRLHVFMGIGLSCTPCPICPDASLSITQRALLLS